MQLQGLRPVRIVHGAEALPLLRVTVSPVDQPPVTVDVAALAAFRDRLSKHAQGNAKFRERLSHAAFEVERLQALQSAAAVTSWALHYLELPWQNRLACYASGCAKRIETLGRFLAT